MDRLWRTLQRAAANFRSPSGRTLKPRGTLKRAPRD